MNAELGGSDKKVKDYGKEFPGRCSGGVARFSIAALARRDRAGGQSSVNQLAAENREESKAVDRGFKSGSSPRSFPPGAPVKCGGTRDRSNGQ